MADREWYATTLGECADLISGGTPSKQNAEYWGGKIPWASAKDMKQFRLHETQDYITEKGAENGTRVVPAGTILVLVRGMTLHNDLPICITMKDMAFNQDVKAIQPKPIIINVEYLAYWMVAHKPYLMSLVDSASHGTGRIHTDILKAVKLDLPPLPEQKAIARILSSLNDKIELNQQMNGTLEAIARAIFKSWFVDFDPVRAKMDGRQPAGMNAATADLFPDSFEDSPLGKIPLGWGVKRLSEITTKIGSGATPTGGNKVYVEEGIALIRSQNVYDHHFQWDGLARITDEDAEKLRGVTVELDDILLNITGDSILRSCVVNPAVLPARVNQHVAIIRPVQWLPCRYLHLYLVQPSMKQILLGFDTGATRKAVTKGQLESVKIPLPPQPILFCFKEITDSLFARINANLAESRTLTSIRDSLLPKLMSAEIRVKNAKKFVEDIV